VTTPSAASTERPGPPSGFGALPFPISEAVIPALTLGAVIVGNLAFKQGATSAADRGVREPEQAARPTTVRW